MATLADRIRRVSDLNDAQIEHLRVLCSSWQGLADLSFSDLLLYLRMKPETTDGEEAFQICAQLRPFTSQTLYPSDMVGTRVSQPEQPIVERAWREGKIWAQDDPVLVDGIPLRMDAVPVRHDDTVVAVITKEGSPATSRRPGRLEEIYLDNAERVSDMICRGYFPYPDTPEGDWPRIGDGLFVVDAGGVVTWASPNALSSLRRLGIRQNILGRRFGDLELGDPAVRRALAESVPIDGELVQGDTHIRMRVLPLFDDEKTVGGLVLARDESDLRQRDRVISVKDATIREIHHRVKNNLQTIASLLRLQGRRLHSEEAKAALQESVLRIGSIALVHETLSEKPSDVADFDQVARKVAQMVSEGLALPEQAIAVKVSGATGPLGSDLATPLAVVVTELVQNAIEHAFVGRASGSISIELAHTDGEVTVDVRDDGVGMRDAATESGRLGLQIVRTLIEELGGSLEVESNGGTTVSVRFTGRDHRP